MTKDVRPTEELADSRRGFLGALAAGLAAVGALFVSPRSRARDGAAGAAETRPPSKAVSWGMAIDLDRCAGCGACVVACKAENNISDGTPDVRWDGRRIEWMTLRREEAGSYPNPRVTVRPMPCNHCTDAACVKVCPVGATYLNDEGIVAMVWDQCIGCRYCMMACPYSRRYFNWFPPEYPEESRLLLNPDVATRPLGVVEKCSFCHHRIRDARLRAKQEERDLVDGDVRTACQDSCPADAIEFGDLNDPNSRVARAASSPRASRMLEELGTEPKVYYLGREGGS
jgi:molybdopterin-containing oxidoreductase family iron-sulfur binding subunit